MRLSKSEKRLFAKLGRKGGKNRSASMTPKQRSDSARKAVRARWDKYNKEKGQQAA